MLRRQKQNPVDYRLCTQTVTVYHRDGATITRTVYDRAFLDFKKTENVDKTGSREVNSFLLVLPCDRQTVFPEDKVLLGIGDEIATTAQWAALIPPRVPGLVVVKSVDLKYWNGRMVHLEAGG